MDWYWIVLIVVGSLALVFLVLSSIMGHVCVKSLVEPQTVKREVCYQTDLDKNLYTDELIKSWNMTDMVFYGEDNYQLHGSVVVNDPKKWVIFAHGYTWAREGSYKYMKLFQRLGFSLIAYDHRGHGDNKKCPITMGYMEAKDLSHIIDWVKEHYGLDIIIGLHGESMGAVTVLEVLKYKKNLSFVIADSPFADMRTLMKAQIKRVIPFTYVTFFGDFEIKAKYHFSFKDVRPYESVKNTDVPILIIHSEGDTLIPPFHTKMIADANKNIELTYFPKVDHTESYQNYSEQYEDREIKFLKDKHII